MKTIRKHLCQRNNNVAVWVAISTCILFTKPNHSSPHHPIAAPIAAFTIILAAGCVAWIYSRKCQADSARKEAQR